MCIGDLKWLVPVWTKEYGMQVTADPTEARDSRPKPARSSLHFQACCSTTCRPICCCSGRL